MANPTSARIENLKKYLSEDPKDVFLRYALAIELFNNTELEEAEKHFEELLRDEPDYLATYYQYGRLLEESDRPLLAIDVYKAGVKIAENQNNARTVKELKQAISSLIENEDEQK